MHLDMWNSHLQWLWLLPLAVPITTVQAEGFKFPTSQEYEFIVGDLVNVTWDVNTPRFSLYEVCDTAVLLESNSTNNYSYIWNATRANYRESGCVFELEPLDVAGIANPPNLTSVLFGVSERYTGDAAPTDYNFGGDGEQTTSTASSTSTATATSSISTTTTAPQVAATTTSAIITASSSSAAHSGLSSAQKVGVGVGVPLGVISLCLLGFVIMWYRRRRRNQNQGDGEAQQQPEMVKAGMKPPSSALSSTDDGNNNNNNRVSGADTLVSELSSQNYENYRDSRPISEIMGTPRAEME